MPLAVPYLDLKAQMQPLRADIDAAIARALDNCTFILGPDVAQFEKDFAAFTGARHCVAMNSGTSALHISLLLAGVGLGDEVITTPFTFAATSWAISYVGAKPVYVDIEESTYNLDPARVAAATGGVGLGSERRLPSARAPGGTRQAAPRKARPSCESRGGMGRQRAHPQRRSGDDKEAEACAN